MTPQEHMRAMSSNQPLCPELDKCLFDTQIGLFIGHPLLHTMFMPTAGEFYNRSLEVRKERADRLFREKDWNRFVFLHERPYRLETLLKIRSRMTPEQFWPLLREVWVDTENWSQHRKKWKRLFKEAMNGPGRRLFNTEDDLFALEAMSPILTVYQGTSDKHAEEFSWSLSYDTAKWFANRFGAQGEVVSWEVHRDDVLAYITARGEEEILIVG